MPGGVIYALAYKSPLSMPGCEPGGIVVNTGRRRFLGQLCLPSLLGLAGCDSGRTPGLDAKPQKPQSVRPEPLVLALFPYDTPSRIVQRFDALAERLAAELGRAIRLHLATSYENQVHLLTSGRVDLAFMGPTSYIRAVDRYASPDGARVHLLAGEYPYRGAIVTRTDSPLQHLTDLRDRTFAFGAYSSLSGHFAPRVMLRAQGLELADLRDYEFLNRHERVALAVLHGDYDAGALGLGAAMRYAQRAPGLRVLAETELLPPLVFVARPDMDPELIEWLSMTLLGLNEVNLGTFSRVTDRDFDRARAIIRAIERPPVCAA